LVFDSLVVLIVEISREEWHFFRNQFLEQTTSTPNVVGEVVVAFPLQHFRTHLGKSPFQHTSGGFSLDAVTGEPKIYNFDVERFGVDQHVFRFHVTVHNVRVVDVIETHQDLASNLLENDFVDLFLLFENECKHVDRFELGHNDLRYFIRVNVFHESNYLRRVNLL